MAKTNKPNKTAVAPKVAKEVTKSPEIKVPKEVNKVARWSIGLFMLAFLVYANTLKNGFALDDILVITRNSMVMQGFSAIPQLLSTPHLQGYAHLPNETYRPLSLVMFAIEYQLGGGGPALGHWVNVLIFGGCVVVLFRFLAKLFGTPKILMAAAAAAIFAVHPIHTEVVANIKSRDELLCLFFAFTSLNIWAKYMEDGKAKYLLLGALSLFLSYISKETVIAFLAIVPFLFLTHFNRDKKRAWTISLASVGVAVLFLGIRAAVLNAANVVHSDSAINFIDNQLVNVPATASALATKVLAMGYYLKMLVWPTNLLCNYSINTIPFVTWGNLWVILSLGAYLTLIAFAIYRLSKNVKDYWALSIIYFLCSIALFSNIPFLIGAIFAERFVFFASVGFCIALPVTIEFLVLKINKGQIPSMDRIMSWLALFPIVAIFIGMTVSRNPDWADNYTLYKHDAEKAKVNSWLWYDLGNELVTTLFEQSNSPAEQHNFLLESIPALNNSIAIYPNYAKSHSDLANAYVRLKKLDSAEHYAKLAIKYDPKDQVAVNNLAAVYFNTARFADALELCKKTVAMKPDFVNGYYNIGVCFFNIHEPDSALVYFKKTYSLAPDFKDAIISLASTYKALDKPDSAAKYEAIAHQKR